MYAEFLPRISTQELIDELHKREYNSKIIKYEDMHCHVCGSQACECEGVPLQVGKKYFCSWEHMRDYLDSEIERLHAMGWV